MGAFQSKKKYDVATGESTIKGKSQPVRIDRKREQLPRFSQQFETLNELNSREADQNVNGVGERSHSNEKQDAGTINKSVVPPVEVEEEQNDTQKLSESDTNPHEDLADNGVEDDALGTNKETILDSSAHLIKVPSVEKLQESKILNTSVEQDVPSDSKYHSDSDIIKAHQEEETINYSNTQKTNDDNTVVNGYEVENNEHKDTPISNIAQQVEHNTICKNVDDHDVKESNAKANENTEEINNTVTQEIKLEDKHDILVAKESDMDINKNTEKHIDKLKKEYAIIETFINEERYANLGDMLPKTAENIARSDENVQAAITVLNDVIEEAGDDNLVGHVLADHQEETVSAPNANACSSFDSVVAKEPSRKRGMIGDPPTKEEISYAPEKSHEEQVKLLRSDDLPPNPQIPDLEMHEISLVSEIRPNNKNEEKFMSHIYLESVTSDDVHYTLDKLQVMEQQIHTTRARILSIKEIDS